MKEFIFDEKTHTYKIIEDGRTRILPGVTKILEDEGFINPSPYWREEHAERGRIVHKICALHDQGGVDESTIDEEYRGYYESYLIGCENLKIDRRYFVAIERPMATDEYAGMPDRVYMDDRLIIPEIKTGSASPWHGVQLISYLDLALANELFDLSIAKKKLLGLYLKRDGRMPSIVDYSIDLNLWRSVLKVHLWKKEKGYG